MLTGEGALKLELRAERARRLWKRMSAPQPSERVAALRVGDSLADGLPLHAEAEARPGGAKGGDDRNGGALLDDPVAHGERRRAA